MAQTTTISPDQLNQAARAAIYSLAKPIEQKIATRAISGAVVAGENTMVQNPLQVGFLRSFILVVKGTVNNTGSTAVTLSPFGVDNLLTNVTFADFTGNPRHNASGRMFSYVEALKYRRIPGAALTSDSVSGFGSIIASNSAPLTIAAGASATVSRVFEIPVMQDNGMNMAGGLWLGVNNQSTLLSWTINANPIVAAGVDPLNALYVGGAGNLSDVSVECYQRYWTNVPTDTKTGNPILPPGDVSTAYMIQESNSGMSFAAGQDASWNYPTFSRLLSTIMTFDNGGVFNPGTDINNIALRVSNYSVVREGSPALFSRMTRDIIGADTPAGVYCVSSRQHPLAVTQYPALQLTMNPSTVNNGAFALMGTELLRPVTYMASASGVGGV